MKATKKKMLTNPFASCGELEYKRHSLIQLDFHSSTSFTFRTTREAPKLLQTLLIKMFSFEVCAL